MITIWMTATTNRRRALSSATRGMSGTNARACHKPKQYCTRVEMIMMKNENGLLCVCIDRRV
jgi:hypothetical protein